LELSRNVEKLFGISCRFVCKRPVLIYDNIMAVHLYRIVQEAVSNAIKHGKATDIRIKIKSDNGNNILTIKNNGLAFRRASDRHRGMGISIMKHRSEIIGASLDIRSDVESGTVVTCIFPNTHGVKRGTRKWQEKRSLG